MPGRKKILIVRDFSFEKMVKRVQGAYSIFCDKFMYTDTNSEYFISDNKAFMDVLVTANRHEVMMCCVVDQELVKKLPAISVKSKPKSLRSPKRRKPNYGKEIPQNMRHSPRQSYKNRCQKAK